MTARKSHNNKNNRDRHLKNCKPQIKTDRETSAVHRMCAVRAPGIIAGLDCSRKDYTKKKAKLSSISSRTHTHTYTHYCKSRQRDTEPIKKLTWRTELSLVARRIPRARLAVADYDSALKLDTHEKCLQEEQGDLLLNMQIQRRIVSFLTKNI